MPQENPRKSHGAVVLCGGKSRRMGRDKASLPFGDETMLARVTRILSGIVDSIVVVAAPQQPEFELPVRVRWARDQVEGQGPLQGIAAGLAALDNSVEAAYITSCDVPLLVPGFVEYLFKTLEDARGVDEKRDDNKRGKDYRIVVPKDEKYHHPLAAVYQVSVLAEIEKLLAADRRRPVFLFDVVDTLRVSTETLKAVDPTLSTLFNLNSADDYLNALQMEGVIPSPEILEQLARGDADKQL